MKIKYLGHSCFRIESQGYSIVLDPYAPGSVAGLEAVDQQADVVLCSHEHGDHNYRDGVKLSGKGYGPFNIDAVESFHDDALGAKRGPNIIHIIDDGQTRLIHMGDQGCMPTEQQLEQLRGADIMLIPVGGFFTIDAQQAKQICDAVQPRFIIPMHFRSDGFGLDVIGRVESFTDLYDGEQISRVCELDSSELCEKITVLSPALSVK